MVYEAENTHDSNIYVIKIPREPKYEKILEEEAKLMETFAGKRNVLQTLGFIQLKN